jgi:deoxyribodipyrimidine photo-lyase
MSSSILWFRHDLRLHDNEALLEAMRNAETLIPVYVFDIDIRRISTPRLRFLIESVMDLRKNLKGFGSDLLVRVGKPDEILFQLALETRSQWVYCNRERTREEMDIQDRLEKKLWATGRELRYTRGKMLYYTSDLPFPVTHCPDSFVMFRKEVESIIPVRLPLDLPVSIPRIPEGLDSGDIPNVESFLPGGNAITDVWFSGGETNGLKALSSHQVQVRHSLPFVEGRVLSPWIALGCLSPKTVYYASFEMGDEGEEVRQHLVYRDYLRLMGKKYGDLIFYQNGIKARKEIPDQNEDAFLKWKAGDTGVPIVDAAMHQLNLTGWMPDVLRKIVANYLIKVLRLDWRLGAAYFESALIDYDPCSNWVSWLNLAGVGPDSREDRIIHYDLVGKKLDPDGSYVKAWTT